MPDRMEYLRELAQLVGRMADDRLSTGEVREMIEAVLEHLGGTAERPYAMGRCVNCGAVHVGWSEYQWAQLVRTNCRACGRTW